MAEHDVKIVAREFLKFDDVEIEKMTFHKSKETIFLIDVDIKKILISDEFTRSKNKEAGAKTHNRIQN